MPGVFGMFHQDETMAAAASHGTDGPVVVQARARDLLSVCALNGVLTLVSLGLFHGWAKTRVRRYLWGHTRFADEAFRYSGSGAALTLGYAAAAVIFATLLLLPSVLPLLGPSWTVPALLASLAAVPAFAFAGGCASYSGWSYLLGHTAWGSRRFALGGRAMDHGALALLYGALSAVTFGLYVPLMRNRLAAHLIGNASFGDERLRYDGDEGELLRRYLLTGMLMLVVTVVWAVLVAVAFPFAARFLRGTATPATGLLWPLALATGATLLLLPALYSVWQWYRAGELRHFVAHARLGGARFALTLSDRRYVWLKLGNAAALLLSLGMAYPWVAVRTGRVLAAAVRIEGVLVLDGDSAKVSDPALHPTRPGTDMEPPAQSQRF